MGANVGALTVALGLDAAQYTEGLTKADVQAQQFAQQQTRTQASIDRTVASLAKQASQIGLTTREIKLQALAAKGASDAQLASADASLKALEAAAEAQKKNSHEAEQAGSILDLFAGKTARARSELIVLSHELSQGNFKRAFGSFQVLAESAGATGAIFSATSAIILASAAAIGTLVFAAIKGAEESHALARAIEETGNAAGLTEGKFNDLATAQAKQTNTTIGATREILQSLAASGRFTGQALTAAGTAAALFSKATGSSAEEASKEFVGLADDIVNGADRMNRQYHFLDASQLLYITRLHEQGDEQKAFVVVADALTERLKGVSTNLGTLETAWQKIKNAASGAWDSMLNIGRTETVEQKLAGVESQLDAARKGSSFVGTQPSSTRPPSIYDVQAPPAGRAPSIYDVQQPTAAQQASIYNTGGAVAELQARQASLQDELKLQNRIAESQADKVRHDEAEIAVMHLKEASLTKQEKLTRDLANANATFDRAGRAQDDPERLKVLADIREKAFPAHDQKSTLDLDVARIKAAAQAEQEIYKTSDQVFSALRAAGLIDEQHYYEEKLFLLQANAAVEEKALSDEIARRKQQVFTGADAANKSNENAKAITEAEAKLAKVRKDAAAQETVLAIESEAAQRRRAAGYLAEELAAQQSLDATKRAHAEEIALVGVGGEDRVRAQAISQITDKYQAEIDRANADIAAKRVAAGGAATAEDEEAYAKRIALLQKFEAASLSEWDAYYAKLKKTEEDASKGWQKGLADYQTNVGTMADRVSKAVGDTFKGLEDALVTFVTTGKTSFKSLADSIVASMVRIAVQEEITKPLAGFLQGGSAATANNPNSSGLLQSFLNLFSSTKGTTTTGGAGDTAMGSAAGVLGAVDSQAANAAAASETQLATSSTAAAATMTTSAASTEAALASLSAAATSAASALATVAANATGSSGGGAGGAGGLLGLFGAGSGSGAGAGASAGAGVVDNGSINLFADAAPGLAIGGQALPGKLYPVNERGPEVLDVGGKQYLMTGSSRANVSPLSTSSQSATQRPIQIIQNFPAGTSKATADQAAALAGAAVRKAYARVR